ncbi:MAG: carboxypeptidase regulatory-like domain-containing protein [Bryobacteraceae bacterium]
MKQILSLRWCVFAVFFCLIQPASADIGGTILGTAKDPSGATVPHATIFLRDTQTGLTREVTTDDAGSYEFLAVPVGSDYVLEAVEKGFNKFVQPGVHLLVNQHLRVDVALTVGSPSQEVTVSAAQVQVETTSTQLGDVVEQRKMSGLPLNGRSYLDLMGLQAGVVPISSSATVKDRPISGELGAGAVSVNGGRENANSFLVNGGDVQESKNNGASIAPTLDSIQEFRVLTNSYDAEYGRFSGGIVNVVTRSGTNELHGSLFEFLRNEKLDARNFFDRNQVDPVTGRDIPNSARGVFKRNQFGGTIGGPILKNRLFYFGDYQGTRERRGLNTGTISVPSLAERNGDFSDTAAAGYPALVGVVRGDNSPTSLGSFDKTLSARLGYRVNSGEPYWVAGCNTAADALSQTCVFPNQIIPQAAWGPVAKATLKFIPTPVGSVGGTPYFSTSSEKQKLRDDKFGTRVTLDTKKTGDWSFYYHFDDALFVDPFAQENVPGFPVTTPSRAQQANVSNTYVFGPTAVNELRLNYTRFLYWQGNPSGEGLGKISSFGFVEGGLGLIAANPAAEGMPDINIGGAYGINLGVPGSNIKQINNTYQIADSFSKVTGSHTLKFGADVRDIQVNEYQFGGTNGNFGFEGGETGNSFADFLLGAPDSFSDQSLSSMFTRSKYLGLYAQDAYKLKSNLTLNLGLRWDVIQPFSETQNRLNALVWGENSVVYPGAPTGWVFTGDPGISKTISPTRYNNLAPRVGVAYSPGFKDGLPGKLFGGPGKTSIRAAFGVYYSAMEDQPSFYTIADAPFGLYFASANQVYLEEPFRNRRNGADLGQRFPFTPPRAGSRVDWSIYQPIGGSPAVPLDQVTPRVMHWNFNIQRELPISTIFTIGYVGTRGRHLLTQVDANIADPTRCLQIAAILTAAGRPGDACGPFGENQIYDLGNGQSAYGTRLHSVTSGRYLSRGILDFGSGQTWNETIANSNYDAMELSLEKRAGPLQLLAAYTWSKSIDNSSGYTDAFINPYNYRLSRALSAFDMTHNFVISYAYNLPFDRLTNGRFLRGILGGWQLGGITRFTTGLPVRIIESGDRSLTGNPGVDHPNYDGSGIQFLDPRSTSTHQYFDTRPFSQEQLGVEGTANVRFFHGPGISNWDVMLQKDARFTERYAMQLRFEFFNVFNHAQFNNPVGNFASSTFGRVTSARDPRIGQVALKLSF